MPLSDRYQLLDRVVEGAGWTEWRGRDAVLHRDVGVLVVAPDHAERGEVAEAARAASMVTDPRFLHVYDVVDAQQALWVVREWTSGTSLVERLADGPLSVEDACALGVQTAQALSTAHACGVVHGALGPGDILLTDDGRIKVHGLGSRRVLEREASALTDPRPADDSWAAAAVAYAGVTGHWPGADRDGLSGTGSGTALVRPRQVRAGVPKVVDAALADALGDPPADPADVARSLERVLSTVGRRAGDAISDEAPPAPSGTVRALAVGAGAALVVAVVAGALWLGFQLTRSPETTRPDLVSSQPTSSSAGPTSSLVAPARIEVVSGTDFDPDGNGTEEPELVPLAFDDNLATAWHTVSYEQADLAPKSGVGVVFDLGRVEPVGAVRLNLLGAGTSLQVRVSTRPGTAVSDFDRFGSGTNVGDLVALRAPEAVQARYVLVWLTKLPAEGETFRGGIAEIQVASS